MYQFIQQVINARQWVDIILCLLFQCTIIDCYSYFSCLLPKKDDKSTPWDEGWLNPSLSQIDIHLPSHLC